MRDKPYVVGSSFSGVYVICTYVERLESVCPGDKWCLIKVCSSCRRCLCRGGDGSSLSPPTFLRPFRVTASSCRRGHNRKFATFCNGRKFGRRRADSKKSCWQKKECILPNSADKKHRLFPVFLRRHATAKKNGADGHRPIDVSVRLQAGSHSVQLETSSAPRLAKKRTDELKGDKRIDVGFYFRMEWNLFLQFQLTMLTEQGSKVSGLPSQVKTPFHDTGLIT